MLDEPAAARIRAYEQEHGDSTRLRWPIQVALVFGAVALGAGVLLFVSAHWDSLSPLVRFALVTTLVAVFHVGGAIAAERFPAMATTLHAIGTMSLGAGIFLAGQIFNLDEHWPGGLMLWTFGAAIAWALLKDWPQLALVALLAPAWLSAEWFVAIEDHLTPGVERVVVCGFFLLTLAYFTAIRSEPSDLRRRTLTWLGGILLVPATLTLAFDTATVHAGTQIMPASLLIFGWTVALGLPLVLAIIMRRTAAWPNVLAMIWVLALLQLRPTTDVFVYAWWALGATALAGWGVAEARTERINMGAAIFAATVLTFYFSQVMDKLGRSASLIGLGLLFLGGGWAIERVRRRLVSKARGGLA